MIIDHEHKFTGINSKVPKEYKNQQNWFDMGVDASMFEEVTIAHELQS